MLVNIIVGFVTAFLVVLASFFSFQRLVKRKVPMHVNDPIDTIEDPHDLYSEDETAEDIKEVIKEEKKALKGKTFKNVYKGAPASFSLYRIASYAIFVMGFIYLQNNAILNLYGYFGGVTAGLVSAVVAGMVIFKKR